ncbi:MAG: hypothetical protein MMC23_003752 [Stictis urceolatum]|nr:hypothetical protein [Stictis urceolata]
MGDKTGHQVHHNIEGAGHKDRDDIPNIPSSAVPYFTPAQDPPAGTATSSDPPKLFQPLQIRSLKFQNRIFLSPLCQYSAQDGHFTDWHLAHLGGILKRGPGLTFIEATSVTPEGRITPQDSGLWKQSQAEALKKVVDFAHSQNQKIGIQIAHAGRKASTVAPWISGGDTSTKAVGGWPDAVVAPSALAHSERLPDPLELSLSDIEDLKEKWVATVKRAVWAGFDVVEIHNAHGYLLHEFLSPVSNKRTDKYGGSWENRARLTMEIVELTRKNIPESMPLFLRLSATDWLEEEMPDEPSWRVEDSVRLAKMLVGKVDLLDVSSGGNSPKQHIHAGPVQIPGVDGKSTAYQAHFAKTVKEAVGDSLLVGTVGGIRDGKTAQSLMETGLDAVLIGTAFLKNPGLVFKFGDDLDVDVRMPNQIQWAFKGRGKR